MKRMKYNSLALCLLAYSALGGAAQAQTFRTLNRFESNGHALLKSSVTVTGELAVATTSPTGYVLKISSGTGAAGQELLYVGNTGNVGISSALPSYRLSVSSGAGEAGTIMAVSTGATNLFWVAGDGAHAIKFWGDGSGLTNLSGTGDNLGSHVATTTLNMAAFNIVGVSTISVSSITTAGAGVIFSTNAYFMNGNVGIGTTNPAAKLDVVGGVQISDNARLTFANSATAGSNQGMDFEYGAGSSETRMITINNPGVGSRFIMRYNPTNLVLPAANNMGGADLTFFEGGLGDFLAMKGTPLKFRIGTSDYGTGALQVQGNALINGNVGIGTTGPVGNLHIQNDNIETATKTYSTPNRSDIILNTYYVAADNYMRYADIVALGNGNGTSGGSTIRFFTNPVTDDNGVVRMVINSVGNVGIGTAGPGDKLHIVTSDSDKGLDVESTNAGTNGASIVLYQNSVSPAADDIAGRLEWDGKRADGSRYWMAYIDGVWTDPATLVGTSRMVFHTRSGDTDNAAMTIDHAGNVGIGTTVPGAKLDVTGDGATVLLPRKSTAGDPAGPANGMIYYNANTGKFRCYQAGAWTDCVAPASGDNLGSHVATTTLNMAAFNIVGVSTISVSSITTAGAGVIFSTNAYFMNGNVGIGTTGPAGGYKLDVAADGGTGIRITDTTNLSSLRFQFADSTSTITAAKNGAVPTAINFVTQSAVGSLTDTLSLNTGNVGIGTTGPQGRLHVLSNSTTDPYVFVTSHTTTGFGLVVSTTGNVGIGTTNPTAPLHSKFIDQAVPTITDIISKASLRLSQGTGLHGSQFLIGSSGGANNTYWIQAGKNAAPGDTPELLPGYSLLLQPLGGNVGIGTPATGYKLDVDGDMNLAAGSVYRIGGVAQSGSSKWTAGAGDDIYRSLGNVGIGTTAPVRKLQIAADGTGSGGEQLYISGAINPLKRLRLGYDTTENFGQISVVTQGSTYDNLVLQRSGGNVGIGTTGPGAQLQLGDGVTGGTIRLKGFSATGNTYADLSSSGDNFSINNSYAAETEFFIQYDGRVGIGMAGPGSRLSVGGNASIGSNYAGTAAPSNGMIIEGNVGIGTTGPTHKLMVEGGILATSSITANGGFYGDGTNLTGVSASALSSTGDTVITADSDNNDTGATIIRSGTSDVVYVSTAGNVGIGTTAPGAKLEINPGGGGTYTAILINNISGGWYNDEFRIEWARARRKTAYIGSAWQASDTNTGYLSFATYNYGFNEAMRINKDGNVGIGTTGPAYRLVVSSGAGEAGTILAVSTGTSTMIELQGDGEIIAKKFTGDGSGITGISVGDVSNTGDVIINADSDVNDAGGVRLRSGGTDIVYISTDNNVGIGTASPTGKIHVSTGIGATSLFVSGSGSTAGNVGIGTTAPGAKLDIQSGTEASARIIGNGTALASPYTLSIQNNGGDYDSWLEILNGRASEGAFFGMNAAGASPAVGDAFELWNWQGGPIHFYTDTVAESGSPRMTIANTGNVGIGTTVPGYKLDVRTTGSPSAGNTALVGIQIVRTDASATPSGIFYGQDLTGSNYWENMIFQQMGGGGNFVFKSDVNGDASPNEVMRITRDGNVGIGTTGPTHKLMVEGGILATSSITANGGFYGDGTNLTGVSASALSSTGDTVITADSDNNDTGATIIRSGTSDVVYVSTAGNVGIGTATPGAKLDVAGDINTKYDGSIYLNPTYGTRIYSADNGYSVRIYTRYGATFMFGDRFFTNDIAFGNTAYANTIEASDTLTARGNLYGVITSLKIAGVEGISADDNRRHATNHNIILGKGGNAASGVTTGGNAGKLSVYLGPGGAGFGGAAAGSDGEFNIYNNTPSSIFSVLHNGNVGIGTTGPEQKLHVNGRIATDEANGINFQIRTASGNLAYHLGADSSGNLKFMNNAGTSLGVWQQAGNVGIGTTAPGYNLDVITINPTQFRVGYSATNYVAISHQSASVGAIINAVGDSVSNQFLTFQLGGSEKMRIMQNTGNVGIGTTGPGAKLDVTGDGATVLLPRKSTAGDPAGPANGMIYYNANTGKFRCYQAGAWTDCVAPASGDNLGSHVATTTLNMAAFNIVGVSTISVSSITTAGAGVIFSTNAYFMNGNVGIGTTGPGALLTLSNGGSDLQFMANNNACTGMPCIRTGGNGSLVLSPKTSATAGNLYLNWDGGTTAGNVIFGNGNGTEVARVQSNGNVGIGTTAPGAKLSLYGTVSSETAGPHIEIKTTEDTYPVFSMLNWGHDDSRMYFDGYYQSGDKSSDAGSTFGIQKYQDILRFNYGVAAAGSAVTMSPGIALTSAGNVGIGTTSPGTKLDIQSGTAASVRIVGLGTAIASPYTLSIQNNGGGYNTWLEILNGRVNEGAFFGMNSIGASPAVGDAFELWNYQGGPIIFYTGVGAQVGSPQMRIADTGNVGIGTMSSGSKLTVAGDITTTSSITVQGSAFSVGGSTLVVSGGNVGIGITNPTGLFQVGGGSLTVLSSGNVGIGTTAPGYNLDVITINPTQFRVGYSATNYVAISHQSASAGAIINAVGDSVSNQFLTFQLGGSEKMRIMQNTGNVGIGTAAPGAKLDVTGDGATVLLPRKSTAGDPAGPANGMIYYNANTGKFRCYQAGAWTDCVAPASGDNLGSHVATTTLNMAAFNIVGVSTISVSSITTAGAGVIFSTNAYFMNGNVGIGTTGPTKKLHLAGSGTTTLLIQSSDNNPVLQLQPGGAAVDPQISFLSAAGTETANIDASGSGQFLLGTTVNWPITFRVNGAEKMRIDTTGNVGIGTTNPASALSVVGDITATSRISINDAFVGGYTFQNSGNSIFRGEVRATVLSGASNRVVYSDSAGILGITDIHYSGGNVGIGTTSPGVKLHTYGADPEIRAETSSAGGDSNISLKNPTQQWNWKLDGNTSDLFLSDVTGVLTPFIIENATPSNSLYIKSTGNVGIGTTVPGAKLTVYSDTGILNTGAGDTLYQQQTNAATLKNAYSVKANGYDSVYVNTQNSYPLVFGVSTGAGTGTSVAHMTILSNGNVGIGTVNPGSRFEVVGGSSTFRGSDSNPAIAGFTDAGGNYRVVISTSGNVGIGTTGPTEKLEVGGTGNLNMKGGYVLMGKNGRTRYYNTANNNFGDIYNPGTGGDLAFRDGAGETMRLVAGNVGIGTTGPVTKLQVAGGDIQLDNTQGVYFRTVGGVAATNNGMTGSDATDTLTFRTAALDRMTISGGNVGIGTTGPGYTLTVNGTAWVTSGAWSGSDRRWKKDITPLRDSLSKVMELQGVNYNWKTKEFPELKFSTAPQIGLIAQDTEKVIPEVVTTDNNGYKGISYEKLVPVLIEAVKDQQKEIEELKLKVLKLEKED